MGDIHWALLVEQIGDGKYKRVGIAALCPHAYDNWGKEFAEIEII